MNFIIDTSMHIYLYININNFEKEKNEAYIWCGNHIWYDVRKVAD